MAGLHIRIQSIDETPRPFRLVSDDAFWEGMRTAFRDREAELVEPFVAEVEAYRLGMRLLFRGRITGTGRFLCSRCGEPIAIAFSEPLELLLEPAQNPASIPEGGIELDAEDLELGRYAGDELDFAPVIQEIVALAWPVQPLCSEDCAGLCPICGAVRSRQVCSCYLSRPGFLDLGCLAPAMPEPCAGRQCDKQHGCQFNPRTPSGVHPMFFLRLVIH